MWVEIVAVFMVFAYISFRWGKYLGYVRGYFDANEENISLIVRSIPITKLSHIAEMYTRGILENDNLDDIAKTEMILKYDEILETLKHIEDDLDKKQAP